MVALVRSPSSQKTESGGSQVQCQPPAQSEILFVCLFVSNQKPSFRV